MNQQNTSTPDDTNPQDTAMKVGSGWSIQRTAVISAGVLAGIIVLIFLIGLAFALFSDVEATAARIEIIKNTIIIIMALEGVLIIASLAILIVQVGRLVNLLQNKAKPVLEDAQEAVSSARGTVEFVGETVTEPIIQLSTFIAGVRVFMSEIGGIRRALRKEQEDEPHGEE
jgi:hypothetical protein